MRALWCLVKYSVKESAVPVVAAESVHQVSGVDKVQNEAQD